MAEPQGGQRSQDAAGPGWDVISLAGPHGEASVRAAEAAQAFLDRHETEDLLPLVGKTIEAVPAFRPVDKAVIQSSFHGGTFEATDDLLAGRGLFYVSEKRRLTLDCTAGHYQMTWGYHHPAFVAALHEAESHGIVWDNHSNIPQWPVKRLAQRLVQIVNPDCRELAGGDSSRVMASNERLNTVLVGVCTGSVACETGLKLMLVHHQRVKPTSGVPVIVTLNGNYHGTGIAMQHLRGMWPGMVAGLETVSVEPNDCEALERLFAEQGESIAGLWAEPVMMNREAILVGREYLQLARRLCDGVGALLAIDEIQTGFWYPEVLMFRQYDITPDIVVVGKGLTAGFHPLSGVIYRRELDALAQYDSISTNGGASLAAYMALVNLAMIESSRAHLEAVHSELGARLAGLAAEFPETLAGVHGRGLLAGLKFRSRETALAFHKRCVADGLWVRAHAYHEGHSTVLSKFALCVDSVVIDHFAGRLHAALTEAV